MVSKVYFTREITPEGLMRIYKALGVELKGKVGVKISSGEPGGNNYLHPELIGELVNSLHGTIIECCTAYGGRRTEPGEHWKAIAGHGFTAAFPCDIMDEFGEMELPVEGGYHPQERPRGRGLCKLRQRAGAPRTSRGTLWPVWAARSKEYLDRHCFPQRARRASTPPGSWRCPRSSSAIHLRSCQSRILFSRAWADAGKAVINYKGAENMLYINVANRLSVDCDCDSHPAEPEMADVGIFASTDPVAVDQACYDAVINSPDDGKAALIERMNSRHAIHVVEAAAELGLGSRKYEIVSID